MRSTNVTVEAAREVNLMMTSPTHVWLMPLVIPPTVELQLNRHSEVDVPTLPVIPLT